MEYMELPNNSFHFYSYDVIYHIFSMQCKMYIVVVKRANGIDWLLCAICILICICRYVIEIVQNVNTKMDVHLTIAIIFLSCQRSFQGIILKSYTVLIIWKPLFGSQLHLSFSFPTVHSCLMNCTLKKHSIE